MSLLDDAIRDHLELMRRRGADPADVARAEREALSDAPPAAEEVGIIPASPADDPAEDATRIITPQGSTEAPEPTAPPTEAADASEHTQAFDPFADEPAAEAVAPPTEAPAPVEPAPVTAPEPVAEIPVVPVEPGPAEVVPPEVAELAAQETAAFSPDDVVAATGVDAADAGVELAYHDAEPDTEPEPVAEVAPPVVEPPVYEAPPEPAEERWEPEPEPEPVYERDPEPIEEEAPAYRDAEPDMEPEPEPAAAAEGDQQAGEDDVLEETPDFLQETPEHDRLWFEQRPPRDFDF